MPVTETIRSLDPAERPKDDLAIPGKVSTIGGLEDRLAAPAASAGYERARRAFELGEQLRALREAQHLSQAELARRMGSTQPAIARLEAGRVAPAWTPSTGRRPPSASSW
jgi:DNA-binding XRE family transcriptional regulator